MAVLGTKRRKTRNLRKTGAVGGMLHSALSALAALVIAPLAAAARVLPSGPWFAEKARALAASRHARRAAGVLGGLALCVGLCVVMKHNLEASPMYNIDPGRIALAVDVGWAKDELRRRVRDEIENDLRQSLRDLDGAPAFDEGLPPRVASALERSSWVARVVRIERRFPRESGGYSELRPQLDLRRPVLAVEAADSYVLVDGDSVRLPLSLKRPADNPGAELELFIAGLTGPLRVVRGVASDPPAPGKMWVSEEISAAISMERVLRESAMDAVLPIEAIELVGVPMEADRRGRVRYRPGGGVVLIPDKRLLPGTSLLWGRPPVHASTLEPSLEEKISVMRAELANPEALRGRAVDLSVKRG